MVSKKTKAEERAAGAKAAAEAQRRRDRNRNLLRGGVAVVVLAALVAVLVVVGSKRGDKVDENAAAAPSKYGIVVGPDTATHKVVIYEDFQCPYCEELESGTRDQFAALETAGTLQVDYRPFDLLGRGQRDSYTVRSTSAFSIVLDKYGVDVAKKFHDLLYENQPSEQGPFPSNDQILALAVQAGATEADVKDAIENVGGEQWVTDATKAADAVDIPGTPTVLVDGKSFAYSTPEELLAAVSS